MLSLNPVTPYHLIGTGLAALLAVGLVAGLLRRRARLGSSWPRRLIVLALSLLAGITLAAATWNPVLTRAPDASGRHLAVLLDVSPSALRADGGWPVIRAETARFIDAALANAGPDRVAESSASLITFAGNVNSRSVPLDQLADSLRALSGGDLAGGDASDLGAGLRAGLDAILSAGGRGEMLLVTDGHDTEADAEAAAQIIRQRGVPVTVLPIDSRAPELAIDAAHIAHQTRARTETILRGSIRNSSASDQTAMLAVELAGVGANADIPALAPDTFARLRLPLTFDAVGLQPVDLTLRDAGGTVVHRRRLFTHVTRPLHLLAIGGDLTWANAVAPDVITVDPIAPPDLPAVDLSAYDGIAISGVPADAFAPGDLARVAAAVTDDGLGFMLINGTHIATPETPTVLRSYAQTPVDDLLPVTSDPREIEENPERQVIFLIDSSGSMCNRLPTAKAIAAYIINALLTDTDQVQVVGFTTGASVIVPQTVMTAANKQGAIDAINAIACGGGTSPRAALELLRDQQLDNCGLVVLSDGEFNRNDALARPDCRATVFKVSEAGIAPNDPLYELADPIHAPPGFDPTGLEIPYFEPDTRDTFWEPGGYAPLSMAFITPGVTLPVPDLRLEGTAISYLRETGEMVAVRPRWQDPVLAYAEAGQGRAGVFTTAFAGDWLTTPDGREALQAYLLDLFGYSERERYAFTVEDTGAALNITIMVRDPRNPARLPELDRLTARLETAAEAVSIRLEDDPQAPRTYSGSVTISRGDTAQPAELVLREFGPDAVGREQRVPFIVPPALPLAADLASEATSTGTNADLLGRIALQTGGRYDPTDAVLFRQRQPTGDGLALWPGLIVAAALLYWLAILLRRLDPKG